MDRYLVSSRCGAPCRFPLRRPCCRGYCMWPHGHVGLCACDDHIEDDFAEPAVGAAAPAPEFTESCNFPRIISAAARRGLSVADAKTLWHTGVRSEQLVLELPRNQLDALLGGPFGERAKYDRTISAGLPDGSGSGGGRADHPVIRLSSRGSRQMAFDSIASEEGRRRALKEIDSLVETENSRKTNASLMNTWREITNGWGVPALPMTAHKVRLVAATLRAGGYRSAEPYFDRARAEHIRTYDAVPAASVDDAIRRYSRAVERGIGPSRLKDAIMLEDAHDALVVPSAMEAKQVAKDDAIWLGALFCLGCWWMTRGIEASAAQVGHLRLHTERLSVEWNLPVSKTDTKALGAARSHRCICERGEASPICPYHVAEANLKLVIELFGGKGVDGSIPFFPSGGIGPCDVHEFSSREYITRCGWPFGGASHCYGNVAPSVGTHCKRCFPELRSFSMVGSSDEESSN